MRGNSENIILPDSNFIGECFARLFGSEFLDKKNILWKLVKGKWIGKRSVFTHDCRACWIEETSEENIKSWWCGKNEDYSELFELQRGV